MKRIELIANRSVQEDALTALEVGLGIQYTLVPVVHGHGPDDWKLGTTVWPEENFMLISYLDDEMALKVKLTVAALKKQYPNEGIKLFIMTVD